MKTLCRTLIALAAFAAMTGEVHAGGAATTKIAQLGMVPSTGVVWIKPVPGTVTGQPACASAGLFVFNANTEPGKQLYKMVLAAQVQNLPLTIYGTGGCNVSSGSEDILYVWYNPPVN